jgi:hypothetical protein
MKILIVDDALRSLLAKELEERLCSAAGMRVHRYSPPFEQ